MKYEKQILNSFENLGKSPRGEQVKYVNTILTTFIDEGKKKVVLSAPTGAGKSIIGAVVADALHQITESHYTRKCSFILMGTNILANQYFDTFSTVRNFLMVKGARNYECNALSTALETEYADSCCEYDLRNSKEWDLEQLATKYCSSCEYSHMKKARHSANQLITNYSYYFIDRLFAKVLAARTITIWDEAHTVNDVFAEHCAIFISEKRLDGFIAEIGEHLKLGDLDLFNNFKKMKVAVKTGKITEKNYLTYIEELHALYTSVKDGLKEQQSYLLSSDLKGYTKLGKLSKKYADLACKIGDLLAYQYEHIFEYNETLKEISIKPIFVGDMFSQLEHSEYQLFMSATVSKELIIQQLALNANEVGFVKLPSTFPVENKKVVFFNLEKLNYTTMKEDKVRKRISNACKKLVNRHLELDENGIILTPSFDVAEMVFEKISETDAKIFHHERGTQLADIVEKFKKSKVPSVLISPSMFEGLSLDDDLSRYQIIVKCPYASLGEKRVKYIAEKHPDIYQLQAILKIIQGSGRSVRSADDRAITYCLDSMLSYLWKNKLNVWTDEFSVSYQTLI
jgi:Rad3-related DNA helicase